MTVTELLTRNTTTTVSAQFDREGSFRFQPGIGTGDPFLDGVHLHAGLRLLRFVSPHLSPRYKRLWPALAAIRDAAASFGAERLLPEFSVNRDGLTGRVDLRSDGVRGIGHIEIKVVGHLPVAPRQRDLRQIALYVGIANRRSPSWAALIYLDLGAGLARHFVFRDSIASLVESSVSLSRN